MKTHVAGLLVALGSIGTLVVGYGCAFNPLSPPDFDERPGAGKNDAMSSSAGGAGGQGGLAGQGGVGGMSCVCPDDNNECTIATEANCPNGDVNACSQSIAFGAKCSNGGCNEQGECVSCLMCDSPECFARCEKMACNDDGQCAKEFCEQNTCCNEECAGPCKACNRPGTEGICTPLPKSLQVEGCKAAGQACDGLGQCGALAKAPLGALCNFGTDCASGACKSDTCRSQNGQPCVEDLECFSNRCDPVTKTCKSCNEPGILCPLGTECVTQNGACQVLLGQPSSTNAECGAGEVFNFLCSLPPGAPCESHSDCESRNCSEMKKCTPLCSPQGMPPVLCIADTACFNGACKLLLESYCVVNSQCESNNCSGFPRRCQP